MNKNILKNIKRNDLFVQKCAFKNILVEENSTYVLEKITNIAERANIIYTYTCLFLKCWIISIYDKKEELPIITPDTIRMIFKVLTIQEKTVIRNNKEVIITQRGPKPKGDNLLLYNKLKQFYNDVFKDLIDNDKVDCENMSQILIYLSTDICTNVTNNIKMHFLDYLRCYVNGCFKEKNDKILEKLSGKNKTNMRYQLRKELTAVKNDLINNTLKAKEEYHEWITANRDKILPKIGDISHTVNLEKNYNQYLTYMIYMSRELENMNKKHFNVLPLRTDKIIKYIPIDTFSIISILTSGNKEEYLNNIGKYEKEIWEKYFKLSNKMFRKKGYKFNYMIYTDCVGVSILFASDAEYEKINKKKQNMKNVKNKMKEMYKGKTEAEIIQIKEDLKKKQEDAKYKFKLEKLAKKEEYKKLPKEEKKRIRMENKKKKAEMLPQEIINMQPEFPYIDELTENQLEQLMKGDLVYVDPGKIRLLTMINDKGKLFKYTNREYIQDTKKLEYMDKLTKLRENMDIIKIEKELQGYNSKSCNFDTFKQYIQKKCEIDKILREKYKEYKFRQYKWYAYINKKRAIAKLINKIKEIYGENCKLIMGDWSVSKQMRNFIPTPMIGLKREIRKEIEIINLDEYKTSKLNYKTETETENMWMRVNVLKNKEKIGKQIEVKMHSILTYKMENNRLGCINRDRNAVLNMRKIVHYWFKHKDRPEKYKRQNNKNGQPEPVLQGTSNVHKSVKI